MRKKLSVVCEDVVCRVFFEFVFVGSSSRDVIQKIMDSDLNEAMAELGEKAEQAPSAMLLEAEEADSGDTRNASSATKKVHNERKKVYVSVSDDRSELAKIGCNPMVSFDDTMPELKDYAAVRTNVFIFIYDTKPDEPDFRPMEVLNVMFAQMQFEYRKLMKRKEKPPALRALVLRNSAIEMNDEEEEALKEFEDKLKEFTAHGPFKKLEWEADMQEADELYDFLEAIVKVISRPVVTSDRSKTTRWSIAEAGNKSKSSRTCCVL